MAAARSKATNLQTMNAANPINPYIRGSNFFKIP
jgi:hypothetical protein